jgi:hypothetical protein
MTRIASLALAVALVPTAAIAAPAWDNQQNIGAPGKVTAITLLSPGLPQWGTLRGVVRIGSNDYQWGGSSCETDLTTHQYAALSLAMLHGFSLGPVYRSVIGSNIRCLVSFQMTPPVSK